VTKCPLMSAKQTFRHKVATSVFDPKRTWRTSAVMLDGVHPGLFDGCLGQI
jgi:hypothetical protein